MAKQFFGAIFPKSLNNFRSEGQNWVVYKKRCKLVLYDATNVYHLKGEMRRYKKVARMLYFTLYINLVTKCDVKNQYDPEKRIL